MVTDLRSAVRVSVLTIAWNTVVGVAAVVTAVLTGSLTLIGFGVNALVDSSVSVLLVWRFRSEERGHAERAERAEHVALRMAAGAFVVIALYLTVQAIRALVDAKHPEASVFGIVEALASLAVLPVLGVTKYRLASRLGSRALRADGMLTLFGASLAAVTLVALVAERAFGWWWADPVGALLIAVGLTAEAVRSLRAES